MGYVTIGYTIFSTGYTENPIKRNHLKVYKTLLDKAYEFVFSEHFRFLEKL